MNTKLLFIFLVLSLIHVSYGSDDKIIKLLKNETYEKSFHGKMCIKIQIIGTGNFDAELKKDHSIVDSCSDVTNCKLSNDAWTAGNSYKMIIHANDDENIYFVMDDNICQSTFVYVILSVIGFALIIIAALSIFVVCYYKKLKEKEDSMSLLANMSTNFDSDEDDMFEI